MDWLTGGGTIAGIGPTMLQRGLFDGWGLRAYVDAGILLIFALVLVVIAARWSSLDKEMRMFAAYLALFYLIAVLERAVPLVLDVTVPLWASVTITLGYVGFALLGAYLLFKYGGRASSHSTSRE